MLDHLQTERKKDENDTIPGWCKFIFLNYTVKVTVLAKSAAPARAARRGSVEEIAESGMLPEFPREGELS